VTIYFSASNNAFYDTIVMKYESLPLDKVEITNQIRDQILQEQTEGRIISSDENGFPITTIRPPLTFEQKLPLYISNIQNVMDIKAKEYGYDNIFTAVTYAEEPIIPKFQIEGTAFREWRSLVWATCYSILDDYQNGEIQEPSVEDIISQLPVFPLDE
jgi:hypothetical protein